MGQLKGIKTVTILEERPQPRVWNKKLADLLNQLDANASDLAARTRDLKDRLDVHTRELGLSRLEESKQDEKAKNRRFARPRASRE